MKSTKTVLAVALVVGGIALLSGCSTPCDDFLTELQVDDVDTAVNEVFFGCLFGIGREQCLEGAGDCLDCECSDCECRDCSEWLVDRVYTQAGQCISPF